MAEKYSMPNCNKSNGTTQKEMATAFCNISVELVPIEKITHVYPLVKEMFPEELKENVPLGGRISHFVQFYEKLTQDHEILEIVKGYKIPLLRTPIQEKVPLNTPLNKNQKFLVEKEIKEMLETGAIENFSQHKDQHVQNQTLRNIFPVRKKRWGLPSGYKSENSKSACTLYAIQNGKFVDFKMYDERYRLHA